MDLGRYLLVEFEPGLHPRRIVAFCERTRDFAGVVRVVDLAALGQDTLDLILRTPMVQEAPVKRRRSKKVA